MELLEEILNPNNLNKAYKKVVSNKGVAGVDGITVEEEFDYLKENKDRILNQIKSEKAANRVLASITKFIEKKLGLKVNAEKSKVTRPTQTKYLGFSFWKSKGGKWKPKPHLKSYQKLIRKLKQLTDRSWSISLDNRIKKINYLVRGWVNYFRIANMKKKITEIDEHLRVTKYAKQDIFNVLLIMKG